MGRGGRGRGIEGMVCSQLARLFSSIRWCLCCCAHEHIRITMMTAHHAFYCSVPPCTHLCMQHDSEPE